mmetsp:Transcript_15220/g.30852  ORF Transcript_15220/g.30852 Transcript_15220/m.30852 type:complete len:121 (+) Transcript_15220:544-906(+)
MACANLRRTISFVAPPLVAVIVFLKTERVNFQKATGIRARSVGSAWSVLANKELAAANLQTHSAQIWMREIALKAYATPALGIVWQLLWAVAVPAALLSVVCKASPRPAWSPRASFRGRA